MLDQPLSREELASVIEGQGAARRVPMLVHFWVREREFGDRCAAVADLLARYPMDAQVLRICAPKVFDAPKDDPEYRWMNFDRPLDTSASIDERVAIKDWAQFDSILNDWPNPSYKGALPERVPADGRYRLGLWWFCFFERHWSLRGMTNALTDFYEYPERVHQLYRALTDFYKVLMQRGRNELGLDGIFTSDDLGHQTAPFFSTDVFRTFFKPYYQELIDTAHALGMHFWLHTCGNVQNFLPDFVEVGLDVLHPIQKHTMDPRLVAETVGSKLCIWAGMDVQQVIPWGTPDEVRQEVRALMESYHRPEGRMMITAGNAINGDCTVPSLEAFLDESLKYGQQIASKRSSV